MLPPALPPAVTIFSGLTPSSEAFDLHCRTSAVERYPLKVVDADPFQNVEAVVDRVRELVFGRHAIVNADNYSLGLSSKEPVLDLLDFMTTDDKA